MFAGATVLNNTRKDVEIKPAIDGESGSDERGQEIRDYNRWLDG